MSSYELVFENGEMIPKLSLSEEDRVTLLKDVSFWTEYAKEAEFGKPTPSVNVILTPERKASLNRLLAVLHALL